MLEVWTCRGRRWPACCGAPVRRDRFVRGRGAGGRPAGYVAGLLAVPPPVDPGATATPMPVFDPVEPVAAGETEAALAARTVKLNADLLSLGIWWIRRMVAAEQPFTEKLTFCWHNHFAISAEKVRQANFIAAQNATLRRLGTGRLPRAGPGDAHRRGDAELARRRGERRRRTE